MESFNKQKWEDLNLSRDEIKNFGQALKKEEFRNLLAEYVKEINDPDNRRQYEEDIIQLENERGVDVKFVHPTSGYVIKTSVNGKNKAFVNICSNDNVGVPSSSSKLEDGHNGACWSIPYCLAPPREDLDKKKNLCSVYDVVFHSDTLNLAKNNARFKKLVNDTALGAIEEHFNVSLDKVNLKFPKMQFKGLKHATVIRKQIDNFQPTTSISDIPNYPLPPPKENVQNYSGSQEKSNTKLFDSDNRNEDSKFTTPTYTIKHRSTVDMQNYTNDPMSKMSATVPNELVVTIDLPLLKCSSDVSVDVKEKSLTLVSEKLAKYKLELSLPYSVDSNRGCAKFDMTKKVLVITLPVKNINSLSNIDLAREDSGVESDNGYGRSNSTSSNEEDDSLGKCSLVIGHKISSKNECCNAEEKDNSGIESFLKPNIHYALPNYTCNYFENIMVFTVQVPNVTPESVKYCFLNEGFHLTFASVGAGFFPVHYALCFMLPPHNKIKNDTFCIKVCDDNVVAQVTLISKPGEILTEYFIGVDQNDTKKCLFPQALEHEIEDKSKITELPELEAEKLHCKQDKRDASVSNNGNKNGITKTDESICTEEVTLGTTSEDKNQYQEANTKPCEVNGSEIKTGDELLKEDLYVSESSESAASPQRQTAKSRTLSECQQGERSKNRGILKLGRSLSESSVDDYASWSTDKTEKTKKTVRFSEVISKQVFRMNSSILGQRKKNQRKTRNKKRAQERRLSESGNESEGDGEVSELNGKNQDHIWLNEPDSSSCEVSEVSDVSDISESDDGRPPSLPCSSKKNHKRRGKKSAWKNAATAKFNYMEY